jgi:aldehyde dehydrogenase (NAD+)
VLDPIANSSVDDVNAAITAARGAQAEWRRTSPLQRGSVLRRIASELRSQSDRVASMMSSEIGKPLVESHAEIANAANVFDFYGGLGHEVGGEVIPSARDGVHLFTTREPLGVVALITPFNFPVNLPVVKLAPALLAGNTVVWKPASAGAATAQAVMDCITSAGIPEGVVNQILGNGSVGAALAAGRIDGISFTGSTAVGRQLAAKAGATGIPCLLELGGKNAVVVNDDADLASAAAVITAGAFGYAGQKCTATSRLIVVGEETQRALLELIRERVSAIQVGAPLAPETTMGPVITSTIVDETLDVVSHAISEGAELFLGGDRVSVRGCENGNYLAPTVVTGVRPEMRIAHDELFAPVLAVICVASLDEAIAAANDSVYGLSAAIFTQSLEAAFAFSQRIETGAVQVNLPTAGLEYQSPFGGRGDSGSGRYEGGKAALEFYSHNKTIAIRHGATS